MPAPSTPDISRFVNKTASFRFSGVDLRFKLSHALFSSFDVDDGTRLLLKTLAQRGDLESLRSVLDVGCGVGVLGACIASRAPGASVVMQDRDALAVAFAAENCRANGLTNVRCECRLAFQGLEGRGFDLVVSNLPAKAGQPVLEAFFRHAVGCLSPGGTVAVVIVQPLAGFARQTIVSLGLRIVFAEEDASYSVFIFAPSAPAMETDSQREDLQPYIRHRSRFSHRTIEYELQTAYSMPDFDTIGHQVELSFDILASACTPSRVLVWNPGQGHLSAGIHALFGSALTSLDLASRDCLETAIAGLNCALAGKRPSGLHNLHAEAALPEVVDASSIDLFVAVPHPVPLVPWHDELTEAARRILRADGELLVAGTSTEVQRLLSRSRGFSVRASKKRAGTRAVLLIRQR